MAESSTSRVPYAGVDVAVSPTQECHATFETSSSAQLFDYRGVKVAGFEVNGVPMICLPQVYELFLKNMVGGLHTVYTKLKRLEITPLICNVEQVRALRGLGAIQPGVNRCKLIASMDFDKLYDDCTSTCTRPGRPSKRVHPTSDDWVLQRKDPPIQSDHTISCPGSYSEDVPSHVSIQNPLLLSNFLPQFTAHQLFVQHMMALASQQKPLDVHPQPGSNVDETESTERGDADVSTPLNLTKTNSNSETCDSDSIENMRKVDASLSPSQYNLSDRGGSSSNGSNNSPSSETSVALNKIVTITECLRDELAQLRTQLKETLTDKDGIRHQLEMEKRRSTLYFRRFCRAKKEVIQLKERLLNNSQ